MAGKCSKKSRGVKLEVDERKVFNSSSLKDYSFGTKTIRTLKNSKDNDLEDMVVKTNSP